MSNAQRRAAVRAERRSAARPRRASGWGWWAVGAAVAVLALVAVVVLPRGGSPAGGRGAPRPPAAGSLAPAGAFVSPADRVVSLAALHGHPTLLWFVSTWCPSCQVGTAAMARQVGRLRAEGVRVVELELYRDLGQAGPAIAAFARTYAGTAATDPAWTFGTATRATTLAYDPGADLDIYYLLDASGRVAYVNSSPATTMGPLLSHAAALR